MTTQHALEQYQYSLVFFLAYFGFKGSEESLYFTSLCTFKHQTNLSLNAGTITQKNNPIGVSITKAYCIQTDERNSNM